MSFRAHGYSSGLLDTADTRLQRRELHNKTGAWAIDDESLFVATYAKEHNLSFAIVRSVSDDASETLPLAARFGIIKPDGSIDIDYLLRAIAKEPLCQTLDLFKLAADFTYSLQTLEYGRPCSQGCARGCQCGGDNLSCWPLGASLISCCDIITWIKCLVAVTSSFADTLSNGRMSLDDQQTDLKAVQIITGGAT